MSSKKRIKGVPLPSPILFREAFDGFVENVAKVHGEEAAETYRSIREGEARVMQSMGVDYPGAAEQLEDFLSFRLETAAD